MLTFNRGLHFIKALEGNINSKRLFETFSSQNISFVIGCFVGESADDASYITRTISPFYLFSMCPMLPFLNLYTSCLPYRFTVCIVKLFLFFLLYVNLCILHFEHKIRHNTAPWS